MCSLTVNNADVMDRSCVCLAAVELARAPASASSACVSWSRRHRPSECRLRAPPPAGTWYLSRVGTAADVPSLMNGSLVRVAVVSRLLDVDGGVEVDVGKGATCPNDTCMLALSAEQVAEGLSKCVPHLAYVVTHRWYTCTDAPTSSS